MSHLTVLPITEHYCTIRRRPIRTRRKWTSNDGRTLSHDPTGVWCRHLGTGEPFLRHSVALTHTLLGGTNGRSRSSRVRHDFRGVMGRQYAYVSPLNPDRQPRVRSPSATVRTRPRCQSGSPNLESTLPQRGASRAALLHRSAIGQAGRYRDRPAARFSGRQLPLDSRLWHVRTDTATTQPGTRDAELRNRTDRFGTGRHLHPRCRRFPPFSR